MDNKIKVLMVTPGLNLCGGIESYCMSYYRALKEKVKFDFVTHNVTDIEYKNEIESNGDKVYILPKITIKNSYNQINNFIREHHDYDIIHCNMANAAFIYFPIAKKYGIKTRILHSHQNKYADKKLHVLRNIPLVALGKIYTTDRIACSKEAGDFLFKKKKYDIVKNAIQIENYSYNEKTRKSIRAKLGINDEFVIGNIGRLTNQKNQKFLIEIFSCIKKIKKKSKLIIIGEGELESLLKERVKELNIENDVLFINKTNMINDFLQAFDIFVFPSLYEGVGIVNIEAQAAGLKVIASSNVPKEAKIIDELIEFIPIEKGKEYWCNEIIKNENYERKNVDLILKDNKYNINNSANDLYYLYNRYCEEK